MERWIIDYVTADGDVCHVWEEAATADEAAYKARQEYWDIKEIIGVRKG